MKLSKIKKDDLELLSYSTIAKMYLEENKIPLNTAELFKNICNLLEIPEQEYQEKITDFFQALMTSKDFILLEDGKWDLKSNHKVKIIYEDDDDKDEDFDEEIIEDFEEIDDDYDTTRDNNDYHDDDLSDLTIIDEDDLENE